MPVLFLEQNVDATVGTRYSYWWSAYGSGGSVTLPLIMTSSGKQISTGYVSFYNVYKAMVDAELARPPQADVEVYGWRVGNHFRFAGRVTNLTGAALTSSQTPRLHALVYEDAHVIHTNRFVRAAPYMNLPALAAGATATFTLDTPDITPVSWDALHLAALADYLPQPGVSNVHDALQAAVALTPTFAARQETLAFLAPLGWQGSLSQTLGFDGPPVLSWTASESVPWLSVSPQTGSVDQSAAFTVSGLSPGWQQGVVTFTATDGGALQFTKAVTVTAYVGALNLLYLPLVRR